MEEKTLEKQLNIYFQQSLLVQYKQREKSTDIDYDDYSDYADLIEKLMGNDTYHTDYNAHTDHSDCSEQFDNMSNDNGSASKNTFRLSRNG